MAGKIHEIFGLTRLSKLSADIDWQNSRILEGGLFLLIVLIEAGICLWLIRGKWMVGGHDGFQYFTLQYYFLNHVVHYGEIPQWMPFLTHGTVASWWHVIQGGLLQNVLLLSGSLFEDVNFLPLFHAGIFVDHLLLSVGVWLLGRRFFSSPVTVFFVTVSVMGSCVWLLQPWWNFHFYYAVPLLLFLVHTFLDSGRWRYAFLAANLLFIQSFGNLPYFLPVISLLMFLYFLFYTIFSCKETWQKIRSIPFGRGFIITATATVFLFGALYAAMHSGTDWIVNFTARSPDGTLPLEVFLTYGGELSLRAWLELILGVSPCLEYTLYIGLLCVPLIVLGLFFNINKHNIQFPLTIMVLVFFSLGTFVSVFFYYSWPMMNYFRHLMLVSPVIKVLLCFLAGFGFEALFFPGDRQKNPLRMKVVLAVMAVLMLGVSVILWLLSGNYPDNYQFVSDFIDGMVPEKLYLFETLLDKEVLPALLGRTALFALTAAVLLGVLSFINRRKYFLLPMIFILVLQGADIYTFKFSEIRLKAVSLDEDIYRSTAFQTMPFAAGRDLVFESGDHPGAALLKVLPIQYGVFYWTTHAFLFRDELGNPFKTDHFLSPLDDYMWAYWQLIRDLPDPHGPLYDDYGFAFPQGHPAALKISGATEDKIQFFSRADMVSSDDRIALKITSPEYQGDRIFLSPLEGENNLDSAGRPDVSGDLAENLRRRLSYRVERFDSNNLVVRVKNNESESAWLLYSDVWHPFWRATVNGEKRPVYKANLAYKAVKLEPGLNEVHFYFKSGLVSLFYGFVGLNALFWLGMILFLSGRIVSGSGEAESSGLFPDGSKKTGAGSLTA